MSVSFSRFTARRKLPRCCYKLVVPLVGVALVVGLAVYLSGNSPVDTRPILGGLLEAHSEVRVLSPFTLPRAEAVAQTPDSAIPSAVKSALALPDGMREDALINLVRQWAVRDPEQALVWAKALHGPERSSVIETVLDTLGDKPSLALRLGRQLLIEEPSQSADYGSILIGALNREEQFTAALEFANSPGSESSRTDWTATIIGAWTRAQPSAAPQIAAVVSRPGVPSEVLDAFVAGWAISAPSAAAAFAVTLPAGETRQSAVSQAVGVWVEQDAKSAADWIDMQLKAGPEFDRALSHLLVQTDDTFYSPKHAVERANSITDPELRADTRTALMQRWADTDRQAALNYLQLAREVNPEERSRLFAVLTQPAPVSD